MPTTEEVCTYRHDRIVDGAIVRGPECGKPATDIEYGDQGRYEYPRCSPHYNPPGRGAFKGPEDF